MWWFIKRCNYLSILFIICTIRVLHKWWNVHRFRKKNNICHEWWNVYWLQERNQYVSWIRLNVCVSIINGSVADGWYSAKTSHSIVSCLLISDLQAFHTCVILQGARITTSSAWDNTKMLSRLISYKSKYVSVMCSPINTDINCLYAYGFVD